MHLKFIFSLFSILLSLSLNAQFYQWVNGVGSTGGENSEAIAIDTDGNIYVAGFFGGPTDFAPNDVVHILSPTADADIFIAKYNPNGELIWVNHLEGSLLGTAYALDIDPTGNVIVAGQFRETVDFDSGPDETALSSNGTYDAFIAKYSSEGELVWAISYGGEGLDDVFGIDIDASGNIYATGKFTDSVDFDPGNGESILDGPGGDAYFAKFDPNGNLIWVQNIGGTANDVGNGITTDEAGNVYIVGSFAGIVDANPGAGYYELSSLSGASFFVLKLDADGHFIWAMQSEGASPAVGQSIAVDQTGAVYTSGFFSNTIDVDPSDSTYELSSNGQSDAFLLKLNIDGQFEWAHSFGNSFPDELTSIKVDAENNIYFGGFFNGILNWAIADSTLMLNSLENRNALTGMLDSEANLKWVKQLAGNRTQINDIAIDNQKNVVASGVFWDTAYCEPNITETYITANGANDFFVLKISDTMVPTELDEIVQANIQLYPNPSSGTLNISFPTTNNTSIFIRDLNGKLVQSFKQLEGGSTQILLPEHQGMYFVEIRNKETVKTFKVLRL